MTVLRWLAFWRMLGGVLSVAGAVVAVVAVVVGAWGLATFGVILCVLALRVHWKASSLR